MKKIKTLLLLLSILLSVETFSQTVYITNTGAKYHRGDCRYLSQSKIATTLKDALSEGYEACKVCRPPVDIVEQKIKTNKAEQQTTSPEKSTSAVQCSGTTKAGARCKRMTKSANGLCYQHGG